MNRRLATPGALLIFAGSFLLYWGLREFGIIGNTQSVPQSVSQAVSSNVTLPPSVRSA